MADPFGRPRSLERAAVGPRTVPAAVWLTVVVPVHNERATLAPLMEELHSALDRFGEPWEALFVDDGSHDGSFDELVSLRDLGDERIRAVRLRRNAGKAAALGIGFERARGEVVVTIDADLQDDPAEIPRLLERLGEGYDLVSGWKRHRCDSFRRRFLSRLFNVVAGRLTGVRLHGMNCGLKAYRAEVVHAIDVYGDLHRYIPASAHACGFRATEVPVRHRIRVHGGSRYGLERYLRGFLDLLTVLFLARYRRRPLHFFGGLGLVLFLGGVAACGYLAVMKLAGEGIGGRPLLLLGVLLIVVGIQLLSLGLLSELLIVQHEERGGGRASVPIDRVLE